MHKDFDLTKPKQMAIGPNADGDMVHPEDWIGLKREIGNRPRSVLAGEKECCHDPMKHRIKLRPGFISLKVKAQDGDRITIECLICGKEGTIQLPSIEWAPDTPNIDRLTG